MIVWPFTKYLDRRREFIEHQKILIAKTTERLESFAPLGTRIAFLDGNPGNMLGEMNFHFLGAYNFAGHHFDQMLIERYPKYTMVRVHTIHRLVSERYGQQESSSSTQKPGLSSRGGGLSGLRVLAQTVYRSWRSIFPLPYIEKETNEIVTGEKYRVRISLVAFPENTWEFQKTPLPQLVSLLEERFGTVKRVWKESIEGVDWVLIAIHGSG